MMEAFILVVVEPGHEDEVYSALKDAENVVEAYRVQGEYDIILHVKTADISGLDRFHDSVLRKLPNVETTETLIASSYRG